MKMMTDNNRKTIDRCIEYIKKIFTGESSGHDFEHSIRVYKTAITICEKENADSFIVSLASLLHDVDDVKLFKDNKNYENARSFMNSEEIDKETQEKIVHIISQVSFKGKDTETPDTLEGMIVQDADRVDAIGAIGIARCFAYGGKHNRKLYDGNETYKTNQSEAEYRSSTSSSIAHFYEKLLLLKDMMNTKEGKRIAKSRHTYIVNFLEEFKAECEGEK